MNHKIILTQELETICKLHKVKTLHLFGSVLTDKFNDDSDIDFIVSFFEDIPLLDYCDNYFQLADALTYLYSRNVDLVTERSLTNPYFILEINNTKQLVYAA